jgi:Flp pilus assembly pilin Flp
MALITFIDYTYRDERGATIAMYSLIFALLALAGVVADATPGGHQAANFVLEHVNRAIEAMR